MKGLTVDKQRLELEFKNILEQLKEKYKPQKIILFGSLAAGSITDSSDMDLFIIKKKCAG